MPRFFNILKKKTVFDPFLVHFPNFGGKKNPALSHTTSYGLLASYQNLEKTNDSIPSKHSDRWKSGQAIFHRILPANAGGSK